MYLLNVIRKRGGIEVAFLASAPHEHLIYNETGKYNVDNFELPPHLSA